MKAWEYRNWNNQFAYYDEAGQLIWREPKSKIVHWCRPDELDGLADMRKDMKQVNFSPLFLRLRHGV